MLAVDQWAALEEGLDPRWEAAKLSFSAEEARAVPESAMVLAPLGPGRVGPALQFEVARLGGGPEKLRNLLGRLDDKRIWGTLGLLEVRRAPAAPRAAAAMAAPRASLTDAWDRELAKLAPRWGAHLLVLRLATTYHAPARAA